MAVVCDVGLVTSAASGRVRTAVVSAAVLGSLFEGGALAVARHPTLAKQGADEETSEVRSGRGGDRRPRGY